MSEAAIQPKTVPLHVISRERGWAVVGASASRARSVHPTQKEAVEAARKSVVVGAPVFIHNDNGSLREIQTGTGAAR